MSAMWPVVLAAVAGLALSGCSHEGTDWKAATAADTTESYQQFLTQHPNGANAIQAHTRIEQLQEERDWQVASSADTRAAYEQFVAQHADSKWAQEARIRIENFAQSASAAKPDAAPAAATAAGTAGVVGAGGAASAAGMPAAGSPAAAKSRPPRSAVASAGSATPAGEQYVQLGAFSTKAHAQWQWKQLSARFAHELGALSPHYVAAKARPLVRLQVAVGSREQAKSLCARLRAHSQPCVPVDAG